MLGNHGFSAREPLNLAAPCRPFGTIRSIAADCAVRHRFLLLVDDGDVQALVPGIVTEIPTVAYCPASLPSSPAARLAGCE